MFKKKRKSAEIHPEDIFIDATNLPEFNTHQMEGHFEKPLSRRAVVSLAVVCFLVGIIFLSRLFTLQITAGTAYAEESEENRLAHELIFTDRGIITDRNGTPLAWNTAPEPSENRKSFSRRTYRDQHGIAHLLGYVSYPKKDTSGFYYQTDTIGTEGVEAYYDSIIGGKNGLKITEQNAVGEKVSESVIYAPKDGAELALSIDTRLQEKLYKEMEAVSLSHGFRGGAGVLLDVSDGSVLAAVNYPEYDANILVSGENSNAISAYVNDPRKPFLNRAIAGLYTPGSIVKPFIAIAALAESIITPEKKIESTGSISLPHPYYPDKFSVFTDWKAHGFVDMRRALAVSSNVYFYEVGGGFGDQPGLGIRRIESYLRRFGIGDRTNIDLGGEAAGIIPTPEWKEAAFDGEPWRVGDTYLTAIGQYGFQVTPIEMARAVAALANGGTLVTPHFEKNAVTPSQNLTKGISPEAFDVVREGMREAVLSGTARGLNIPAVTIAAKTGTAERGDKSFVNSWIIGFYPYEKPRYAFAIVMERGERDNLIGALFVMRNLLEWMAVETPEYLK